MTTPAHEPLWDLGRVLDFLHEHGGDREQVAVILASEIVYEYEAVLAFDRTRYAEQKARIDELEAECARWLARIDELDTWLGEAWTENTDLEQQLAEARKRKPMRVVTQPDFVIDLDDD